MELEIFSGKWLSQYFNLLGLENEYISHSIGCSSTIYKFKLLKCNYTPNFTLKCIKTLSNFINVNVNVLKDDEAGILKIRIVNKERYFPNFFNRCDCLENTEDGSMLFGIDENNEPIIFNIQKTKSLLVAGTSGSGKSVAMNNLICSLALFSDNSKVRINLIDLKRVEFSIFQNFCIVDDYASDYEKAILILNNMLDEIQKRYKIMEQKGIRKATTRDFPILITFIDEYAELSSINQKVVDGLVSRIAQIGRACNVYLVIATQTPTNKVISNLIRSNIQSRIGLRTTNTSQSVAILQTRDCVDLLGAGDSYLSIDGVNGFIRVQICNITEDEILKRTNLVSVEEAKKYRKKKTFIDFMKGLFKK